MLHLAGLVAGCILCGFGTGAKGCLIALGGLCRIDDASADVHMMRVIGTVDDEPLLASLLAVAEAPWRDSEAWL